MKAATGALAVFLLAALAMPLLWPAPFTMRYNPFPPDNYTYLSSDLTPAPSISAPQAVCTGSPVQMNFTSTSSWNTAGFEGGTANGAIAQSELVSSYSQASPPYSVRWVDSTQSQQFRAYGGDMRYWVWQASPPSSEWQSFLSGIGISNYHQNTAYEKEVGYKYQLPGAANGYFPGLYRAFIGLFCDATATLTVDSSTFSQDEFLGSQITKSTTLSAGQHTIGGSLRVNRCMGAIRNILNNPSRAYEAWGVVDDSFAPTFTAAPVTVSVENPFSCNLATSSPIITPTNPPAGTSFTFSFVLQNNGNRDISVSAITAETGSAFTNVQITSPSFPFTVTANGGTRTITGTATAPATQGTYPLRLNITSQTTAVDCTGTIKGCNVPQQLIVSVLVAPPPPMLCDISFVNHGPAFTPGDSAAVRANCSQSGVPSICPAFTWSQTATGGSMSPTSTPAGANPQSTLSISAAAPFPQTARSVSATNGTITCGPLSFEIQQDTSPTSCTLAVLGPSGGSLTPGENAVIAADCRNAIGQATDCPQISWTTTVAQGSMFPSTTSAAFAPNSTLTVSSSAPVPQSGRVVRATTQNFSCTAPIQVVAPGDFSFTCSFEGNHGPIFHTGEQADVIVECTGFSGNCLSLDFTTTISSATLTPANTSLQASPVTSLFAIGPSAPSPQTGTVDVSCSNGACNDTCSLPVQLFPYPDTLTCSLVDHSNQFAQGDSALVRGDCTNNGNPVPCPQLQWSTTILGTTLEPGITNISLSPTTNFSTYSTTPIPQNGLIDASRTNPSLPPLTCAEPILAGVANLGPDYIIIRTFPRKSIVLLGETFSVYVWVANLGNQNGTASTTRISGGCQQSDRPTTGIDLGRSVSVEFSCTCSQSGPNNIFSQADVLNQVQEINENNNAGSGFFYCDPPVFAPTCSDYV